jgi:hypothetical protein
MYDRANAYMPRFIVYLAAIAFGAVILSFFLPSDHELCDGIVQNQG